MPAQCPGGGVPLGGKTLRNLRYVRSSCAPFEQTNRPRSPWATRFQFPAHPRAPERNARNARERNLRRAFQSNKEKKNASSPFGFQVALLGFRAGSAEFPRWSAGFPRWPAEFPRWPAEFPRWPAEFLRWPADFPSWPAEFPRWSDAGFPRCWPEGGPHLLSQECATG